jgi:halocyanin-like protein
MNSNQADRKQTSDSSERPPSVTRPRNDDSGLVRYGRRGFLRAAGGVAVAGLLAGCTSGGSGGNAGADTGGDESGENSGTNDVNKGRSVEEWLADTSNYDSVEDMIGTNSVTVEVGAEGNNGANAFAPAAIRISPETTVTWKWINGYHNVVATGDQFSSGEPEQNATFEHTFEEVGTALYYCEPHRSMGMKGAVIVSEDDSGGSP